MYCKSCGEMIIGNEKVCPKCGEPIHSGLDIPEKQMENSEEYTYVKPKSKFAIFYDKLIEVVGRITGIAILVMLVWYIQIWPHHIYKVGCNYLEDKVFTEETEYKIKKYDKKYISDGKDKEVLDLGEGKMSYHHFYLTISVTLHSDELGDVDWVYKMEIFVHPFGEDGVFKKSRFVRCSGQPTWIEEMQDLFDEWETETQKSIDEYFGDSDWSTTESTTEAYSYDNDNEYESKEDVVVDNTPIELMDISGRYVGIDNSDTLEISMYSSPEGNEVGNFNYCGNSGVIVYQNGQCLLYGDYNMVMDVWRNAEGVIQVTLWGETGGEKYSNLIMVEHFQS